MAKTINTVNESKTKLTLSLNNLEEIKMWATNGYTACKTDVCEELAEPIEKALKALKIIVKKANIRLYHLNCSNRYYFKTTNNLYEISREKYELLKEVLL